MDDEISFDEKVENWLIQNDKFVKSRIRKTATNPLNDNFHDGSGNLKSNNSRMEKDEDESLQSVDTAKYILTNNKKTKTKTTTMTIKEYCYLTKRNINDEISGHHQNVKKLQTQKPRSYHSANDTFCKRKLRPRIGNLAVVAGGISSHVQQRKYPQKSKHRIVEQQSRNTTKIIIPSSSSEDEVGDNNLQSRRQRTKHLRRRGRKTTKEKLK